MSFPVTVSDTPLVFDALPAVKTTRYHGVWPLGGIYTLARMYIYNGALHASLSAFEKSPPPESRVGLAVCAAQTGPVLFFELSPAAATLTLQTGETATALPSAPPQFFNASDEQGWSWGASFELPAAALEKAGVRLAAGSRFYAGLYKYTTEKTAFGTLCTLRHPAQPFSAQNLEPFEAVPY